jgi:hypothetical protein
LIPLVSRDGDARDARLNSTSISNMNTNRGIFESFPNPPSGSQDSPFTVALESASGQSAAQASPFTAVDEAAEFGKPVKLPERRKVDSPFQVAEPSEGFGFEAPVSASAASPFEPAPAVPAYPSLSAPVFNQPADSAFKPWHESAGSAAAAPAHIPSAFAPAPLAAATLFLAGDFQSDSSSIRQLELRAIFGVDRELTTDEILQRARALPGIRGLARVGPREMAAIDGLKNLLPSLGLGGGPLKLYSGATPLEFIREGAVLLAVQVDGGFPPGVRETLMIIARELGRGA